MLIRRSLMALATATLTALAFSTSATAAPAPPADDARGCCSHHKGVCGCNANVVACCDNTLSPTCTC